MIIINNEKYNKINVRKKTGRFNIYLNDNKTKV